MVLHAGYLPCITHLELGGVWAELLELVCDIVF